MPINLTDAQITRLRQRPHRTRVWLSVFQPGTVLATRINHPGIAMGEREIQISVLAGDFNDVQRGMTCYIGSTPGGQDLGRIRAISATGSVLTLAENAVTWTNGWYLTVVAYYEPWAVFPRILLDPNNIPLFYKDFDIAYTDQNQNADPVVNMGPHHAGFMASGAHGVYYSSSGSFNVEDGSATTGGHVWVFEGGVPSASFVADPGYIQYTGAGHFLTTLQVTGDNGKTFVGRRHISIYTRPDEGPRPPILSWSLKSLEGSRDDGGYAVRVSIHEAADFSKFVDGALIVLFTDDWEGGVAGKKAAGAENRDSILFVGYIEDDSITVTPVDNFLEFNVRSVTGIARRLATYSASLESKQYAMTWYEYAHLTADKATVHFLRWHSTLLAIADFSPTGDGKQVQYADFQRGNLYDAVNQFYNSSLLASLVANRQGKMWAEVDGSLMPTGTVRLDAMGTGFVMSRQDWRSQIAFGRQAAFDRLSYVELGGLGYGGPGTGTFGAYIGGAPGEVAGYYGQVERASGLIVEGQDQLNALVGLSFARANSDYPEVELPIAGDYRFIDIAPQGRLLVTLTAQENYRGIVWDEKPFIPGGISYEPRAEDQALLMTVRAREETHGPPGVTVEIPVDPPYDDFDLPDWDIDFPPIIPFPPVLPPILPPPGTGNTVYALIGSKVGRTSNFFEPGTATGTWPNWTEVPLTGVTGSLTGQSGFLVLDTLDPANRALLGTSVGGGVGVQGPRIYYTENLAAASPTWTEIWGIAENDLVVTGSSAQKAILAAPERRWDGQWHFPYGRASLGAVPAYIHGDPRPVSPNPVVAWTYTNINTLGMNYQTATWENLVIQGTSVYFVGQTRLYWNATPDLSNPANWEVKRTSTFMQSGAPPIIPDFSVSQLIMWCEGTSRRLRFSSQQGTDGGTEIVITFASSEYALVSGEFEGKQPIKAIPDVPGAFYFMANRTTGAGPVAVFGVVVPGSQPLIRASFSDDDIGPVEVMPSNSQKLCSFGRTAASGGRIMGSQDGGYTWYDKTGDWTTAIGALTDVTEYRSIRFAFTI